MKKLFSFALVLVVVLGVFTVSAMAGGEAPLALSLSSDKNALEPGDEFTVSFNLTKNEGNVNLAFALSYDSDVFELVSKNNASPAVIPGWFECNLDDFWWDNSTAESEITATGKIATATLKVKSSVTEAQMKGYSITVTYQPSDIYDIDLVDLNMSVVPVNVTVGCNHAAHCTKVEAKANSCTAAGNKEYYTCDKCHKLFSTSACTTELSAEDVVVPAAHKLSKVSAKASTCSKKGNSEYWECTVCKALFSDAAGTVETNKTAVELAVNAANHTGTAIHHAAKAATCADAGNVEYYECPDCHATFSDSAMTTALSEYVISAINHVGFVTEYPAGTNVCEGDTIHYWYCSKCQKYFNNADLKPEHEITEAQTHVGGQGHIYSVTWGNFNADYTEITATLKCQRPGCTSEDKQIVCKLSGGDGTITYGVSTATCGVAGYIPVTATIPAPTAPDTFLDGSLLSKEGNKPADATGDHHYTVEILWNTGSETPTASYSCSCLGCSSQPNGNCEITFEDTVPATCVAGTRVYTATVTDDTILSHLALGTKTFDTKTVALDPVATHDLVESETNEDFVYVAEVAATKDKAGMKAHWECKDHGVIYTLTNGNFAPATQAEIDALAIAYVAPVTPSDKKASPKTGDDANIALWAVILTVSAVSVGAVLNLTKKSDI